MENIIIFGSCRVSFMNPPYDFTHCSKEILQIIKFIKSENPNQFFIGDNNLVTNRYFSSQEKFVNIIQNIKNKLGSSKLVVIEISSLKILIYKKMLTFQLDLYNSLFNNEPKHIERFKNIDKNDILENTEITVQTKEELYKDLEEIYNFFTSLNIKVLYVSYVNFYTNTDNDLIENRKIICDTIKEFTITKECYHFDPNEHLGFEPKNIFDIRKHTNYGHYSKTAESVIFNKLKERISEILK